MARSTLTKSKPWSLAQYGSEVLPTSFRRQEVRTSTERSSLLAACGAAGIGILFCVERCCSDADRQPGLGAADGFQAQALHDREVRLTSPLAPESRVGTSHEGEPDCACWKLMSVAFWGEASD